MALRQPASRLAVTLSVAGGASPRTGAMRTRSGPSCASSMLSNRATASGLR